MTRQQDIQIQTRDGPISAYVTVPKRPKKVAIVILQEIFGVNANIRAIADDFARADYATVAPDLYSRQEEDVQLDPSDEKDRAHAMELMAGLDREQAVLDSIAALQALRATVPGLDRSVAVGYCYGGSVAFLMGARGAVDAGVAYYGTGLHTMLFELDELEGRLLLHVAGEDHLCPPEAQRAIAAAAAKTGGRVEVVTYQGVGHAFARAGGAAFDDAAAGRANAMTLELIESLSRRGD